MYKSNNSPSGSITFTFPNNKIEIDVSTKIKAVQIMLEDSQDGTPGPLEQTITNAHSKIQKVFQDNVVADLKNLYDVLKVSFKESDNFTLESEQNIKKLITALGNLSNNSKNFKDAQNLLPAITKLNNTYTDLKNQYSSNFGEGFFMKVSN